MSGEIDGWMVAILALLPPAVAGIALGLRGTAPARFVAVEFAASIAAPILILTSFAFEQPSVVDLALALALLGLPGTLLSAQTMERWR